MSSEKRVSLVDGALSTDMINEQFHARYSVTIVAASIARDFLMEHSQYSDMLGVFLFIVNSLEGNGWLFLLA
jgi:hypothetical protein